MRRERIHGRVYLAGILIVVSAVYLSIAVYQLHFSGKILLSSPSENVRRGLIFDRNKYILAISVERESIYAHPKKVKDPIKTAEALSRYLGISRDILEQRLKSEQEFVWIRRKVSEETASKIRELKLEGVSFRKEMQRVYPSGSLASNILGFVGVDGKGLEGIEYKFNDILTLQEGSSIDTTASGCSIALTIDRFIQHQSEVAIADAVIRTGATQGVVVVMEVKTGKILAIGKYPTFDPNYYELSTPRQRQHYTVTDSFEPGSTLKIIAMALLLELFPSLDQRYLCEGKVEIADTVINCIGVHGHVSLVDIIKHSCNAGMIQAMKQVQKQSMYDFLRKFGFGMRTGVELPGESEGILRPLSKWSGLSKYSMAIGQEISVTSLQLAAAFSAIGNLGVYMVPTIVEQIERSDGSVLRTFYPRSKGAVISKGTARRLLSMMKVAVESGTGKRAAIAFYIVVGKTGTAQKSRPGGGYDPGRETALFVGLAPYPNPDVCILVVLDEPSGASGGAVAAPVFAQVAERILPYIGIAHPVVMKNEKIAEKKEKVLFDGSTMPNFSGLTLAESVRLVSHIRKTFLLTPSWHGTGRVYYQVPPAGTKLSQRERIKLYLKEE
ncbi:MAG: penicillin-binding transpeptidase domain-containing protein [Spirochaetes bacterium]|nr:penicillin-binding transpeptidase domain-containing protein [Spirochaetota bacterium]